jgi:hypothetical protein
MNHLDFTYELLDLPIHVNNSKFNEGVFFAVDYLEIYPILTIEFEKMEFLQCGNCDFFECEADIAISSRLNTELAIATLFHEMVHIKQFMDNRLEGGLDLKWLGEEYQGDYINAPWEVEAYSIEKQMTKEWNK